MHSVVDLANKAMVTPRFRELLVRDYANITDEAKEMQFAAVTFLLPDQSAFLSFRGTDNTLVGWKEDLNMSFVYGVPSQVEAAKYSNRVVEELNLPVRLGGHSKGGNLAIWAGSHLKEELKDRVIKIYNNDGPGFSGNFLQTSNYLDVRDRIQSFVPESSIVGVLMDHDYYTTIRSLNPLVLQHDPFSWLVTGISFIAVDKRTLSGRQFERVINSWIRAMSMEEREQLIESLYDILISANAKTLDDFDKNKIKSIFMMQKTFREMGIKKQAQLLLSLSKVVFNNDILNNGNLLNLLADNPA